MLVTHNVCDTSRNPPASHFPSQEHQEPTGSFKKLPVKGVSFPCEKRCVMSGLGHKPLKLVPVGVG